MDQLIGGVLDLIVLLHRHRAAVYNARGEFIHVVLESGRGRALGGADALHAGRLGVLTTRASELFIIILIGTVSGAVGVLVHPFAKGTEGTSSDSSGSQAEHSERKKNTHGENCR